MGLSSFLGSSEGLLPLLMVSTMLAITVLKRASRSFRGSADSPAAVEEFVPAAIDQGRVLVARFKSLYHSRNGGGGNQRVATECCGVSLQVQFLSPLSFTSLIRFIL